MAGLVVSACGGGASAPSVTSTVVTDHVHAVVQTASTSGVMLATHYGLLTSTDAGRRWRTNPGLGDDMVGGLVHEHGRYVAAVLPEESDSTSSSTAAPAAPAAPAVEVSTDGRHWTEATGIPRGSTVTALVQGPGRTVWASLLGLGVFRSADEGRSWQVAVPSKAPITTITVVGGSLVLATDTGIFVTATTSPIMPALPQLTASVDDLEVSSRCASCLVAALADGGVAVSSNGGVSWTRHPFHVTFETVASPATAPDVLIGTSPEPSRRDQGLWRSTDQGTHWTRVLSASLIDHLYQVPATGSDGPELLAFQWGIRVFASGDEGLHWTLLSRAGGVPTGAAMAATPPEG